MIVTRLQGGLGNQMFQYAFGYALSQKHATQLYYDCRWFGESHDTKTITKRSFSLDCFNIRAQEWNEVDDSVFFPRNNLPNKVLHQLKRRYGNTALLYEAINGYDINIVKKSKRNSYAVGYWQTHLYFEEYRKHLLQHFQFLKLTDNASYLEHITQSDSVAIHVRRGDYANIKQVNAIHGLLPLSYYETAIETISERATSNTHWFIFSDDLPWCMDAFNWLKNKTFCFTNQFPHWYDMFLMSRCKQHIIANSSYSWWGAWLSTDVNKKVIAPYHWFKNSNSKQLQLHPNDWIIK